MFWSRGRGSDGQPGSGGGATRRRRSDSDTFEQPPLPTTSAITNNGRSEGGFGQQHGASSPRQRFGNGNNNNHLPTTTTNNSGFGSQSKLNGHDPCSPKYHQRGRIAIGGSNLAMLRHRAQIKWARLSRLQRLVCAGLAAVVCTAGVCKEAAVLRRVIRRRYHRYLLYRSSYGYGYGTSLSPAEERRRKMLGFGTSKRGRGGGGGSGGDPDALLRERGIVPWELDRTGRDPGRDALVDWWLDHPEAPVGLSCAAFEAMMEENDEDGKEEGREDDVLRQSVSTAAANAARKLKDADTYFYRGYGIAPPVFQGRVPETASASGGQDSRVQVAFVMPFVEFQLVKVATLLTEHWARFPPCRPDTPRQSADLVFFTENPLGPGVQRRIRSYYAGLGSERTGCFRTDEPIFLSMTAEVNPELSHLEGAAFTFYSLFRLLEKHYQTFVLAEPDVAPVQPNFLPALVKKSRSVNCEADGFWQFGSLPLTKDVDAGMLRERVDYHMNGNAIYVLGCAEFEEYKCRVQSFYIPKDECELVAGCSTHEAYEGGYDHALYRFRMHPDNYEYARLILHKFGYSDFVQNRGEGVYDPAVVVRESPSTYFVHSKSIYQNEAATILKEVTVSVLKRDPCNRDSATEKALEKIYHNLRSGEYTKADAIRALCDASKYTIFGPRPSTRLCEMYADSASALEAQDWNARMPGKTYLWTMDFHGGPANCDMSMIAKAGGALHAEIDGICQFYGLCKQRLKVIKADHWKEFDPTEKQKKDFEIAYRDDPEFKRVDAFICHHPVANCELFLPFNRSIIIHATTRLEFGRHDEGIDWRLSSGYDRDVGKVKWQKWVRTVQNLARDKRNVIAANNVYDRDYIKYFTGIEDVELIPSWCGDNVGTTFCEDGWESSISPGWLPTKPEVVIVPYRSNLDRSRYKTGVRDPANHPIIKELDAVPEKISNGTDVKMIRDLYSDANPLRMLKHPAVIILPYQISTMNLVELYRLNIPAFCPSLSLLKRWCREHDLMWEVHYGWPENLMGVKDIPNPNGHALMDKYSKEWEEMFDHWIPKSDFYQFPHITYFDSWEHFHKQYKIMASNGELDAINHKMTQTNAALKEELIETWKSVLQRVKRND